VSVSCWSYQLRVRQRTLTHFPPIQCASVSDVPARGSRECLARCAFCAPSAFQVSCSFWYTPTNMPQRNPDLRTAPRKCRVSDYSRKRLVHVCTGVSTFWNPSTLKTHVLRCSKLGGLVCILPEPALLTPVWTWTTELMKQPQLPSSSQGRSRISSSISDNQLAF
jgi:hypothetical protein